MTIKDDVRAGVVLAVEDDSSVATVLCEAIKTIGYDCIVAPDARSAFQLLSARVFSALVLDLQLGDERAEDLIERLDIAGIRLPPTVIVSGQPNVELRLVGRATQAAAWLKKPFSVDSVIAAIEIATSSRP